ncbi:MAG: hypothetical protein PVI80_11040 [Anaerolineae bacterium]|jgi:hypothetical protein
MSDISKPAAVSEQEPIVTADLPDAESTSAEVAVQASQGKVQKAETTGEILPEGQAEREVENLRLLIRFLLGGLLMGSGSFMQMVRDKQQEIEAEQGLPAHVSSAEDESLRDLFRYLSIGLLVEGTEGVTRLVGSGFRLSLDATRQLIAGVDRATDNRLARPLRQAMTSRLQRLEHKAEVAMDKGRVEEQKAKLLAGETIDELIDQVVDTVAESPELTDMIVSIVGQQGKGVVGVAGENARSLTVIADSATERFVRRLFGRKPRQELPPSPIRGVPQSMYSAEELAKGEIGNEQ